MLGKELRVQLWPWSLWVPACRRGCPGLNQGAGGAGDNRVTAFTGEGQQSVPRSLDEATALEGQEFRIALS